jgi:hypothetical protein
MEDVVDEESDDWDCCRLAGELERKEGVYDGLRCCGDCRR